MDDPTILPWAAENGRLLVTQDVRTMPDFAYQRVTAGQVMPGVFVAAEAVPVGVAIERAGDDRGSERSGRVGGSSHLPPAALTTFFATSRRYPSINLPCPRPLRCQGEDGNCSRVADLWPSVDAGRVPVVSFRDAIRVTAAAHRSPRAAA
jgi:hypothetical protein